MLNERRKKIQQTLTFHIKFEVKPNHRFDHHSNHVQEQSYLLSMAIVPLNLSTNSSDTS